MRSVDEKGSDESIFRLDSTGGRLGILLLYRSLYFLLYEFPIGLLKYCS